LFDKTQLMLGQDKTGDRNLQDMKIKTND